MGYVTGSGVSQYILFHLQLVCEICEKLQYYDLSVSVVSTPDYLKSFGLIGYISIFSYWSVMNIILEEKDLPERTV